MILKTFTHRRHDDVSVSPSLSSCNNNNNKNSNFRKEKRNRRSSQRAVNENPHKFSKILNLIKKTLMIIFSTVTRFQNPYLIVLVLNHLKIYNSIVVTRATRRRRRASFFRSVNDSPAAKLHIRRRSSHRPFSFSAFSHHCVSVTLKYSRERER